ncbi:hypothetical protein U8V72_17425 [Priestia filamentosa]|uniref:hypothetical protein n=1 Tax=Priestia filamentosa TaxID=1402861 RepID=UPI00397E3C98
MSKKTSEEMIEYMKNMNNVEKNKYLEWLFHEHFDTRAGANLILATQHHLEDDLQRDLTEDEMHVMKFSYEAAYHRGGKDGVEKALKTK